MHGTFFISTSRGWLLARVSFRVSFFFRSHPSGTYRRGDQFFIVGTATCGECGASSCFGVADACLGMHVGSHEGRCHGRCSHVGSLVVDAAVVCRDVKCGASSTPIHTDCGHAAQNLPRGVFPPTTTHTTHTPHPLSLLIHFGPCPPTTSPPSFGGSGGMGGGFSIDLFPCLPTLLPMDKEEGPIQPWVGLGSTLPHPMPRLLLLSTTRLTITCGCEGLVDVDPIPPPNRGVQKGHDPGRKKERNKDVRRRRRTESLPNRMEGGRKTQPNHPTNTTRAE